MILTGLTAYSGGVKVGVLNHQVATVMTTGTFTSSTSITNVLGSVTTSLLVVTGMTTTTTQVNNVTSTMTSNASSTTINDCGSHTNPCQDLAWTWVPIGIGSAPALAVPASDGVSYWFVSQITLVLIILTIVAAFFVWKERR